jgi:protein-tyrosine kinase
MSRIDQALKQAGGEATTGSEAATRPSDGLENFPAVSDSRPVNVTQASMPAPNPSILSSVERLVVSSELEPMAVEQYRRLAAILHQAQTTRDVKVVMIASAEPSEGKTLTAANLALTLSESYKRRVLLVDADLRSPALGVMFQVPFSAGLSESLRSDDERPLHVVNLSPALALLPGGGADADPMAGLTSGRMQQIIQEAAASFDWVILDTPPIGLMSDAHLLAAMVDVAVLVIGAGSAGCAAVQHAIESIGREKIVGAVLNRAEEGRLATRRYYNYRPSETGRLGTDLPEVVG